MEISEHSDRATSDILKMDSGASTGLGDGAPIFNKNIFVGFYQMVMELLSKEKNAFFDWSCGNGNSFLTRDY